MFDQIKRTFEQSADIVDDYSEKMGSVFTAMNYILRKDNRTPQEQNVVDGLQYLCRLMLEHERFENRVYQHYNLNLYELFPMSDYLRKRYLETLSDFLANRYLPDFNKAVGIPDKSGQLLIDERLREQKAIDFDALFQKDRRAATKLIEDKGEALLVRRDLSAKDDLLIRKMNFLADSLEIKKPPTIELDFGNTSSESGAQMREQMIYDNKTAQLTTENYVKMLYLNNADPETFDTEYWAEVMNLNPQKLRNLVYNFSVPLLGDTDAEYKLEYQEVKSKTSRA